MESSSSPSLFKKGRFPYNIVAWCAKRLILAMEKLHQNNILHCDIHPGNVCVTRSWSLWETLLQGETVVEPIRPVFIDYQWARMNGFHPKLLVSESASCLSWVYASDRALRLEDTYRLWKCAYSHSCMRSAGAYSASYDLQALSYVLLALRMGSHPPWFGEVTSRSLDVEDLDKRSEILHIRDRMLSAMSSDATVEPELLAFIHHTRHLSPTDTIDYKKWADVFDVTVSLSELEQFFYAR